MMYWRLRMTDKPKPTNNRRHIPVDLTTGTIYENIAKALNKQPERVGFVYIKDAAKLAALEFVKNHPELKVKI